MHAQRLEDVRKCRVMMPTKRQIYSLQRRTYDGTDRKCPQWSKFKLNNTEYKNCYGNDKEMPIKGQIQTNEYRG